MGIKSNVLKRASQKCKGCEKSRIELSNLWDSCGVTGVAFSKGYCPYCAYLQRHYHGNEELIEVHKINQQLRKNYHKRSGRIYEN